MQIKQQNDNWRMQYEGQWLSATVPGSVYSVLLSHGKMDDPFYRDNELQALSLMEQDYVWECPLTLSKEDLQHDSVRLVFEGVDTLAEISLVQVLQDGTYGSILVLGRVNNMHRSWCFELGHLLQKEFDLMPGAYMLRVTFQSPTKFIRKANEQVFAGGSHDAMVGFPHLRKAHCMFGWDWGPRLPDMGLFRGVKLELCDVAELVQVRLEQEHHHDISGNVERVTVTAYVEINGYQAFDGDVRLQIDHQEVLFPVTVSQDCGASIAERGPMQKVVSLSIDVKSPKLWWPRGYGEQPLYPVRVLLQSQTGEVLDTWEKRIGLRTMTMHIEKDIWGESFAHEVNGVQIFAMGADYIPEDNILCRVTSERTARLLQDAVLANHNAIRVWGGGYYPDDFFFDLCDEYGLLVWQDFMFACASYELTPEFDANIQAEIRENVRRIRHHASLALWCGNNEMETQTLDGIWGTTQKQKADYTKMYEYIFPQIVAQEDPQTFYWPSSPSSGGSFDNPWDENRGDAHYWDVWHGNKPFSDYRRYYFRYLSEFGFQSFPELRTVETFTVPEDRNIFSRVMEMHQRNRDANGKILNYLSATFRYPKDFKHLLYASQLLQAEAIRYGIEHFRRHRGRCMGTLVWQLNDIWPVASWASIDYFGRWKALHYVEKRAFAPIMISAQEEGEMTQRPSCIMERRHPIEKSVTLCVANETMHMVSGVVTWTLHHAKGEILERGEYAVEVPALSSKWLPKLDFSKWDELSHYVSFDFMQEGKVISSGTAMFTAPKHFNFANPELEVQKQGKQLRVTAKHFAKYVCVEGVDGDVKLSDNFFDMNGGEERLLDILEGGATQYRVISVYDIA